MGATMKRILITAIILLAWAPAWAGSTTVVVGQGSAAPAGDTCGTDDCTFIWYAEHATDVTSGTPAGCSSGDTSPALTGATISSAQYHDGSNSLLVDHVQEYAAFDVADIISQTAGTVEAWVRVSTWTSTVTIFQWKGTADGIIYLNVAGSSNTDIEFHFRYGYPYNNLDLTTDAVNGALDTWYRVVIKWTQSNVDPNIGIYVYNASGDLLDSETSNTNPNAWGTITGTTFSIGCYPYFAAETPAINIDGVKIWNAWKD